VAKVNRYCQIAPAILRACIGMATGSITIAIMTADIVNIAAQFDTDQSDIGIVGCATIPLAKARLSAASPGAQLPLLIWGVYYEGWRPARTPTEER